MSKADDFALLCGKDPKIPKLVLTVSLSANLHQIEKPVAGTLISETGNPEILPGKARYAWSGALARVRMDWKRMSSIGFRWVICACSEDPGYDPFPLKLLARIGLTDLNGGGQPDCPGPESKQIAAIASNAFLKLNEGGIFVHCVGGRGRTGTIIGAILRHCGYGATDVIDFLDAAYRDAGRPGWPESPWQSQVLRRLQTLRHVDLDPNNLRLQSAAVSAKTRNERY